MTSIRDHYLSGSLWIPWLDGADPSRQPGPALATSLQRRGFLASDPIEGDGNDRCLEVTGAAFDLDVISHHAAPPTR